MERNRKVLGESPPSGGRIRQSVLVGSRATFIDPELPAGLSNFDRACRNFAGLRRLFWPFCR